MRAVLTFSFGSFNKESQARTGNSLPRNATRGAWFFTVSPATRCAGGCFFLQKRTALFLELLSMGVDKK